MKNKIFTNLTAFLDKLEQKKIDYTLAHPREDAIMVLVAVPGERWEIEFLSDGSIEIEKFISTGEISGAESLEEMFARYAEHGEHARTPSRMSQ